MSKYQKLYSNHSSRLQTWDYSKAGYYFVTMSIRGRKRCFGEIRGGVMHKTPLGEFAEKSWRQTPELRPSMNIWLGEFVVMPDHFHAVLRIGVNDHNIHLAPSAKVQTKEDLLHALNHSKNAFRPQTNNLASIVRGFKAAVTTEARRQGVPFEWVSRYHESLVRNAGDLHFVRSYIRRNVESWKG
jgi:REP element-mobilizing transposase RayT